MNSEDSKQIMFIFLARLHLLFICSSAEVLVALDTSDSASWYIERNPGGPPVELWFSSKNPWAEQQISRPWRQDQKSGTECIDREEVVSMKWFCSLLDHGLLCHVPTTTRTWLQLVMASLDFRPFEEADRATPWMNCLKARRRTKRQIDEQTARSMVTHYNKWWCKYCFRRDNSEHWRGPLQLQTTNAVILCMREGSIFVEGTYRLP